MFSSPSIAKLPVELAVAADRHAELPLTEQIAAQLRDVLTGGRLTVEITNAVLDETYARRDPDLEVLRRYQLAEPTVSRL